MNQILVTEKVYVTKELKRKKKLFKIEFIVSLFLIFVLSSYYIYAEYDRNKSEQVSQQLLAEIKTFDNTEIDTTIKDPNEDVMIIFVDDDTEPETIVVEESLENTSNNQGLTPTNTTGGSTSNNKGYTTDAVITIPKIGITYPVLSKTSEKLLLISVNKFHGPNPNEVGNYCIVGHNYRNGKMFGQLSKLKNGDVVQLKDMQYGRTIEYQVYNKYVVEPTDTKCTSQLTNGKREVTLITCTNYGTQRLVVKCREI